jgi:hypothetical protein
VEIGVFPVEKKAKKGLKMGKKAKNRSEMGKRGWCGRRFPVEKGVFPVEKKRKMGLKSRSGGKICRKL